MLLRRAAAPLMLLAFVFGLLRAPQECAAAVRCGIVLCAETVIPSLFPFFVFSSLFVSCGMAEALGRLLSPPLQRFFSLSGSGAAALVLGLLGGYPVGARTAAALYRGRLISGQEAERLLAFCNNAGPGFILGICGGAVFRSTRAGVCLCLVHAAAALLTGRIVCRKLPETAFSPYRRRTEVQPLAAAFPAAVTGALTAVLNVSAFVIFFQVISRLVLLSLPLPDLPRILLLGFLEMTGGVTALPPTREGFLLCAAMLSWGGLSVHAQTLSVLSEVEIDKKLYFYGKIIQTAISLPLAWAVSLRLF